jgi:hypothetical protein
LNGAAVHGTFTPFYLGGASERLNSWRRRTGPKAMAITIGNAVALFVTTLIRRAGR